MDYDIVSNGHKAVVSLPDKAADGDFTGYVKSDEFGSGSISGQKAGNDYTGTVNLAGHSADFKATVDGNGITGEINVGWFFHEAFTGTEVA